MTTTNPNGEPYPARITWRGSVASAKILEDRVNRIDGIRSRGGFHPNQYASADPEISEVANMDRTYVRETSRCVVDTYDGRHVLSTNDTLVQTQAGWTVEPQGDDS